MLQSSMKHHNSNAELKFCTQGQKKQSTVATPPVQISYSQPTCALKSPSSSTFSVGSMVQFGVDRIENLVGREQIFGLKSYLTDRY